jgi:hypothetical protein
MLTQRSVCGVEFISVAFAASTSSRSRRLKMPSNQRASPPVVDGGGEWFRPADKRRPYMGASLWRGLSSKGWPLASRRATAMLPQQINDPRTGSSCPATPRSRASSFFSCFSRFRISGSLQISIVPRDSCSWQTSVDQQVWCAFPGLKILSRFTLSRSGLWAGVFQRPRTS